MGLQLYQFVLSLKPCTMYCAEQMVLCTIQLYCNSIKNKRVTATAAPYAASSQSTLGLCGAVGIDPASPLEREAILNFQHPLTNELLVKEGHPVQLQQERERNN